MQFCLHPLALGDVARCGKDALQRAGPVVKRGRVVGHDRLSPVAVARRQLVVGDLFFAQYELDPGFGPLRIGEMTLERRTDQLVPCTAGERLHLLVDIRDDAGGVGGHQRIDVGFDQRARVELLVSQTLIELCLLLFDELARCVIRADQKIADDGVPRVPQRGYGYYRGEPAPVLPDIGQFIDILDSA